MRKPFKAPYLLTREQWKERMRVASEQLRSYQEQSQGAAMLDYLSFGVRDDINLRLESVQKGDVVLTPWCSKMLIARIESPVTFGKVRARAKRLGLLMGEVA